MYVHPTAMTDSVYSVICVCFLDAAEEITLTILSNLLQETQTHGSLYGPVDLLEKR